MTKKIDYYSIIGKMAHRIDDEAIVLWPSTKLKGNVLKQFSDYVDKAISSVKRQERKKFRKSLKHLRYMIDEHNSQMGNVALLHEFVDDAETELKL